MKFGFPGSKKLVLEMAPIILDIGDSEHNTPSFWDYKISCDICRHKLCHSTSLVNETCHLDLEASNHMEALVLNGSNPCSFVFDLYEKQNKKQASMERNSLSRFSNVLVGEILFPRL